VSRRLRLRGGLRGGTGVPARLPGDGVSRCTVGGGPFGPPAPSAGFMDEQELRMSEEAARKEPGPSWRPGAAAPDERAGVRRLLEYRLQVSGAEGGWGSHSFFVASGPERPASRHPHGTALCHGGVVPVDSGPIRRLRLRHHPKRVLGTRILGPGSPSNCWWPPRSRGEASAWGFGAE
jgi:hypothetical protein